MNLPFSYFRYCFHKPHCAEALENAAENVDSALEILFVKYFNVIQQEKPANIPTKTELLEMIMDEKAVLDSIYENSFKATDTNIWTVNLDLDYLTNVYRSTEAQIPKKREDKSTNFKTKKKEACKLFLRGSCRFGAKCKFSHETQAENKPTEIDYTDSEKVSYELEIRFPENSLYPYEPPILFFKPQQSSKLIPELTCLRITARLYDEAKTLAQDGIPSIYTLVELLNNEEDILNFIKFDTRKFPEAFEALFPQLIENSNSKKLTRPSHYKKGETKDRSNINFNAILKENSEIVKWWLEKRDNNRYHKMLSSRKKLPAWKKRKEILDTMDKSQVSQRIKLCLKNK